MINLKNDRVLTIDPGKTGSLALYDGTTITVFNMPKSRKEISDMIIKFAPATVYIEDVGKHIAGNDATSSVKLAKHVGFLQGVIITLGINMVTITPQSWMNKVVPGRPKGMTSKQVTARKKYIMNYCNDRFPYLSVSQQAADSVGILLACVNVE